MSTKEQIKQVFIEVWNDHEVDSKEIHTELTKRLKAANLISEESELDAQGVRQSYHSLGADYDSYRKRPRKKQNESIVFDFGEPVTNNTISNVVNEEPEPEPALDVQDVAKEDSESATDGWDYVPHRKEPESF